MTFIDVTKKTTSRGCRRLRYHRCRPLIWQVIWLDIIIELTNRQTIVVSGSGGNGGNGDKQTS